MARKSVGYYVETATRIILGGIFLVSGILKALDPQAFFEAILTFDLVPIALAHSVALILPYLEIFGGLALVFNRFYQGALPLLTGLMLFFWFLIILSWFRDLDITCGCFGKAENNKTPYPFLVARNTILSLAFLWLNHRLEKQGKRRFID